MCVAIPMFGMIESLNLGTSSGIVLYEVTKQRREYQSQYRRSRRKGKRAESLPTVMPREDETALLAVAFKIDGSPSTEDFS
jgi:tRNA (guanosine-2'-O-)-methyltransferase